MKLISTRYVDAMGQGSVRRLSAGSNKYAGGGGGVGVCW